MCFINVTDKQFRHVERENQHEGGKQVAVHHFHHMGDGLVMKKLACLFELCRRLLAAGGKLISEIVRYFIANFRMASDTNVEYLDIFQDNLSKPTINLSFMAKDMLINNSNK